MSSGKPIAPSPDLSCGQMLDFTIRACRVAKLSADALLKGLKDHDGAAFASVKSYEEQLDHFDFQVNEGVTTLLARGVSETDTRQLLTCLKFIIELERIGDLLLNVANRFQAAGSRLDAADVDVLAKMCAIVGGMLDCVADAFIQRAVPAALKVLRQDAELDRVRNLMFVRHVENPEHQPVRESYHLVFMTQTLERAGDHVKNLAEEVCHLATGRSVRHILREYDKPTEQMFVERWRKSLSDKP